MPILLMCLYRDAAGSGGFANWKVSLRSVPVLFSLVGDRAVDQDEICHLFAGIRSHDCLLVVLRNRKKIFSNHFQKIMDCSAQYGSGQTQARYAGSRRPLRKFQEVTEGTRERGLRLAHNKIVSDRKLSHLVA